MVPVGAIGGVARHVLDVVRTGIPGWRIVVLTPAGPLSDRLHGLGVPTLVESFGPEAGLAASRRALSHAVSRLRPDVVHTHLAFADLTAATIARGPAALISTEHGIAADDRVYHGSSVRSAAAAAAHRARLARFDALIAVSAATARAMQAKWHPRRPITVLPNGVDRPAPDPAANDRAPGLRITSLARLSPEKGLPELLDAFAVVLADHPDARLTVAGEGPLRDELVRRSRVLGIDDAVKFPGFVDAAAQLSRTDVLAQLSVWENCSYSLLDAVAAGVGVVATPVGGNPEILPARCLVGRDDPEAIAAVLVDQGLTIARRPTLPDSWPSCSDMTARLAGIYASAATAKERPWLT
ncbi:glycosyltransferase family 4 protein [Raineyella sp. LH-20]|uniref:glycosyltransferase family 4 protein n=1 Tax=Raineyella sp. LH-20 TaxID=3081204 RepID=UPI002955D3CA|nr:glycosyltransferase family 4 protein [Raineyella sp. LH-20]WOP20108.1 glycosyltransferase family 4 protein [Raineyella sp. LH-20]